ncbi:MAG: leucyl/phenylalanyl-tRNA--protein transferase [Campylobacteraceae bacterium]|jgi:leucyl/phenylalanyl-tRNA--protein transferase|nr:leucyl/phenylalanyl-tRNA--protein transferase [Campylobacteraceae bacterium]
MIYKLKQDDFLFPDPKEADKNGIVAFGGDLNPKRLISAYQSGIFPWPYIDSPLLWFSPNPRAVLYPDLLHVSRSFRRSLRRYEIKIDENFYEVITLCAKVRENRCGTWITDEMIKAYCELFEAGFAHSVESYDDNGVLVGGLYGVCVGNMFCGESMFSLQKDASKAAFYALSKKVEEKDGVIDCQIMNAHLKSLGAVNIPRDEFLQILAISNGKSVIF